MTFDFEDNRKFPLYAADTSKGSGVDSLTREPEKTDRDEEEEHQHPAKKDQAQTGKEKTHHA